MTDSWAGPTSQLHHLLNTRAKARIQSFGSQTQDCGALGRRLKSYVRYQPLVIDVERTRLRNRERIPQPRAADAPVTSRRVALGGQGLERGRAGVCADEGVVVGDGKPVRGGYAPSVAPPRSALSVTGIHPWVGPCLYLSACSEEKYIIPLDLFGVRVQVRACWVFP